MVDWLVGGGGAGGSREAFDGLVVFDECHKAKNFVAGKEANSTKVWGGSHTVGIGVGRCAWAAGPGRSRGKQQQGVC